MKLDEKPELIPIDTKYKGYFFRSRLEARWAVFFDCLGWNWLYEHEGFKLPSGAYLPDFFFPDIKVYAEVKPTKLTIIELQKCIELSERNNSIIHEVNVVLLEGAPGLKHYRTLTDGVFGENVIFVPLGDRFYPFYYSSKFDRYYFKQTKDASEKARSSRFEFEWREE